MIVQMLQGAAPPLNTKFTRTVMPADATIDWNEEARPSLLHRKVKVGRQDNRVLTADLAFGYCCLTEERIEDKMTKHIIHSAKAPAALGPYSQAVSVPCKELIFCSGQIALDPATQQLVAGDVRAQTRRVMENLKAVLEAAGSDFSHVLKCNVYLLRMSDFAAMNEVYAEYFKDNPPARATMAVAELPKGAQVEIDATACR
jgi:2-iminobutanoate/2-iminopropanoate deaminase